MNFILIFVPLLFLMTYFVKLVNWAKGTFSSDFLGACFLVPSNLGLCKGVVELSECENVHKSVVFMSKCPFLVSYH